MDYVSPFNWATGAGVVINVTNSSAATLVNANANAHMRRMRVVNAGSSGVYIESGGPSVTVSVPGGLFIPAGAIEVLTLSGSYVAAIAPGGSATLHVMPGEGT